VSSELQVRRLKLRELRVLLAAVQAGSMVKAAKQLAISQPAVSRAIDDLEKTLGVPLFDRTARGIEPTQYGRALLRRGVAVDETQAGCSGDRAPLQSRDRRTAYRKQRKPV
jgi:DNA-binding transcriptional LysR family regulator